VWGGLVELSVDDSRKLLDSVQNLLSSFEGLLVKSISLINSLTNDQSRHLVDLAVESSGRNEL
jgi:hypothetical protein